MESQDAIFLTARDIADPAERARYLTQACGKDADLRQRVEALVRDAAGADEFFGPDGTVVSSTPVTEGPGTVIGRFKLLEKIGEGGMGVVYMAEQREPVIRKVALKIIKLGMDTRQVIARFEAERQALALMDHPNIAKVLDGGATDSGRPYFVMDLVPGLPITQFCDEANLPTHDRLELFLEVCSAIQHAHQKGIIHRDIKPSNILVTLHGDKPVPKVIDFGVAKATQGRLTDKTLFTQFQQFIGTPAYMSPEQASLSGLDIDTRSDIYALGVLLYELLTGRTPFDGQELLQAGLDEMRRTIREKQPPRPSNRISTLQGEDLTATAKHRRTDPPKLIHLVRGDLDWIVMKALEKDRARRYETANGLAADIKRHINCEPVVARPPSRLYEFQQTVRRHKFGFAATAALITVLAVGVLVSRSEAIRARRAEQEQARLRRQAETEAAKSEQVAQFMKDMLKGVGPKVALGRDTKLLHEILDNTAERARHDLRGQPEVAAELLSTIGGTYLQVYDFTRAEAMEREALRLRRSLYGDTNPVTAASLNGLARVLINRRGPLDLAEAERMTRQALSIWKKLGGDDSEDAALSLYLLGSVFCNQGKLTEAETVYRKSLAIRRRLFGNEHKDVASALDNLGLVLTGLGKLDDAEEAIREALMIQKKLFGAEHPDVGDSLLNLATVLGRRGKLSEAEAACRDTVAMRRKLMGNDNLAVGAALSQLAGLCREEGKLAEAEAVCREELALEKKLSGSGYNLAHSLQLLSDILYDQAKWAEAEAPCRESINLFKQLAQDDPKRSDYPIDLGHSQCQLANVLAKTGRRELAEQILREAAERGNASDLNALAWSLATSADPNLRDGTNAAVFAEKAVAATNRRNVSYLDTLAAAYAETGQFAKAVSIQHEAIALSQREEEKKDLASRLKLYESHSPYRDDGALAMLANARLREGKFVEAEAPARECLTLREIEIPDDWRTFNARSMLGGSLLGQKKYAEAEPLLLAGYQGMKQREARIPLEGKPRLTETLQRLVQLYEAIGRPDQAAKWQQKLAEFDKAAK
ncbi:MAG: serine/threonine-protein kinase [Verrucomicrobiota bacterium]|jgi:serine/threonine protein kinase/TolA-binding protein